MLRSSLTRRPLWLIAGSRDGRMEILTINSATGREALPVFSFEKEAELFLGLEGSGRRWQARETDVGELISVLYGPCEGVKEVVLEPPLEVFDEAVVDLLSLNRKEFARILVGKGGPAPLRRSQPSSEGILRLRSEKLEGGG